MNTAQLVELCCDGNNSLNQIVDLLGRCGHDRTEVIDAWIELSHDDDYDVRYLRVPRRVGEEDIGLDEPVLYRT